MTIEDKIFWTELALNILRGYKYDDVSSMRMSLEDLKTKREAEFKQELDEFKQELDEFKQELE